MRKVEWTRINTKVLTSLLFLVFLTNCSGVNKSSHSKDVSANEKILSFCELTQNVDLYDDQLVHTSAYLYLAKESAFLYDVGCSTEEQLVSYDTQDKDSVNKKLLPFLINHSGDGTIRLKIKITGIFKKKKDIGFGHLNAYNYLFIISEVEVVESNSNNIPLPW